MSTTGPARKKLKRAPLPPNSQAVLAQRVKVMKTMSLREKTRKSYEGAKVQFVFHLLHHHPELVGTEMKASIADEKTDDGKWAAVVKKVRSCEPPAPLDFQNILPSTAENFLMSITREDGSLMSLSTYKTARSAIGDFYRSYGFEVPEGVKVALKTVTKGLQRTDAQRKGQEGLAIEAGKRPLEFSHYIQICRQLLMDGKQDDIFALLFTILGWNLIARCGNVGEICLNHMRWSDDALQIQFAHMKTDQGGDRARYARHCYANPLIPEISIALALGLYCLYTKSEPNQTRLFPGNDQAARYRAKLASVLKKPHIKQLLKAAGLTADQIASHSLRKGSATMCCCGVVDCPGIAALTLRAGWTLPGVQGLYIQYEAAGDQYVGRTVSGLPLIGCEFAILPPRFIKDDDELVIATIRDVFSFQPPNWDGILSKALASLVYHEPFLRQVLPAQHPLFKHALFATPNLIDQLRAKVVAGLPHEAPDHIVATGIPGRIHDRLAISQLTSVIQSIIPTLNETIRSSEQRIIDSVSHVLEQNAIAAQSITPAQLRTALSAVLNERGVTTDLPAMIRSVIQDTMQRYAPGAASQAAPSTAAPVLGLTLLSPDYKLPEDFSFAGLGLQSAWHLYCQGLPLQGVPPVRLLVRRHTRSNSQNARLGDMRFLFVPCERYLRESKEWKERPTLAEMNQMLASSCHLLEVPGKTPTGKDRLRIGQMAWKTVVEARRWKLKQPAAAPAPAVPVEVNDVDMPSAEQ